MLLVTSGAYARLYGVVPSWASRPSVRRSGSLFNHPDKRRQQFDATVGQHLDVAYNLARWLAGNRPDAEDIVQEAFLRAFRYFHSWNGGDARAWLLAIVRNTHRTWTGERGRRPIPPGSVAGSEVLIGPDDPDPGPDPEARLLQMQDRVRLVRAIAELPTDLREVIVLRDLQELPFREVAAITNAPITTVQSRLNRAREALRERLMADCERVS